MSTKVIFGLFYVPQSLLCERSGNNVYEAFVTLTAATVRADELNALHGAGHYRAVVLPPGLVAYVGDDAFITA